MSKINVTNHTTVYSRLHQHACICIHDTLLHYKSVCSRLNDEHTESFYNFSPTSSCHVSNLLFRLNSVLKSSSVHHLLDRTQGCYSTPKWLFILLQQTKLREECFLYFSKWLILKNKNPHCQFIWYIWMLKCYMNLYPSLRKFKRIYKNTLM